MNEEMIEMIGNTVSYGDANVYWNIFGGVLIVISLFFIIFSISFIVKIAVLLEGADDVTKIQFRCKRFFFTVVILFATCRFFQYVLVVGTTIQLSILPGNQYFWGVIVTLFSDSGTLLFALVYASLLVFWFSFLEMSRGKRHLYQASSGLHTIFQIVIAAVIIFDWGLSLGLYFSGQVTFYYYWQMFGFLATSLLLIVEGMFFFIVGAKLYLTLIGGRVNRNFQKMSTRSKQLVILAISVTLIMLFDVLLIVFSLALGLKNPPGSSDNEEPFLWIYYAPSPLNYFLYYVLGDAVPVLLTIAFQARLPTKNEISNRFFSLESNERIQGTTKMSGDSLFDGDLLDADLLPGSSDGRSNFMSDSDTDDME